MAPSFDYAVSSLLCAEEDTSIFDEVDNYGGDVGGVGDFDEICNWQSRDQQTNLNQDHNNINNNNNRMMMGMGFSFSGFVPMQIQSEECLGAMFDKENQHLPALDYLHRLRTGDLDLGARKEAIDWIEKVQSHYNFGPLCLYLSISYMDRFLSAYDLPKGKAWMMQLLAVACLSLAAKMEETDVPLSLDLQVGEAKYVFEAKAIQRMELLVLSTLKWRMQSVTPFSFIDYFLDKISNAIANGDQNTMLPRCFIFQSIQLILSAIKGIDFLEFKPSEIAAAVAISVTEQTQTTEHPDKALSFLNSEHVQKERVIKCVELIHDLTLNSHNGCDKVGASGSASTSVPQSPNGVLDAACLSYKSDDVSTTPTPSGSCANSTHNSPAPKRRKLDNTFQWEI